MVLRTTQDIVEGNFIKESEKNSTPANDADKVPRLENNGKVSPVFLAPVIAKQTTVQNSPASTTETTVLSYTIAAGVLGTGNGMRYRAYMTSSTGGVSATTTVRLKLGSTTLISMNAGANGSGWIEIAFFNNGSASSQVAFGAISDPLSSNEASATGSGSEATSSSKALTVTCQLSNAAGAYAIYMQTLEVL